MRWTSPWIVSGLSRPGTNSLNKNSVPTGSGRLVLMNVPPREMFLV